MVSLSFTLQSSVPLTSSKMLRLPFSFFAVLVLALCLAPCIQGRSGSELHGLRIKPSSAFETALETLQKQLGYTFQHIGLLRRAMTHASFSEENNKALSVLGLSIIDASVAFKSLGKDIEISSKELNNRISKISNVDSSCAVDAIRFGLQKVVRVSPKTNSSAPTVVCGAFRAIFGAIALDSGKTDDAGNVFWDVHGVHGRDAAL